MVKAVKKTLSTFVVDCSKPVDDKIMEIASFEKFLQVRRRMGLGLTEATRRAGCWRYDASSSSRTGTAAAWGGGERPSAQSGEDWMRRRRGVAGARLDRGLASVAALVTVRVVCGGGCSRRVLVLGFHMGVREGR